ncbi:MAG: non-heme iron oxygenase ferredoxin subunit [Propionibacteriaceae bacterium]|nr:non-heme iron oxygenase ferredoxin subunit [Propionibacteriaceae bacterium]
MTTWHQVIALDELEDEEPTPVQVGETPIALVRVADDVYALHDICTHEVAPLSDGFVEDGCLECPLHQGLFDLATGKAVKEPCTVDVRTYQTRVVDGTVEIEMETA